MSAPLEWVDLPERSRLSNTPQPNTRADWRTRPGYFSAGHSDFESVHILLGRFLADRYSPDPLPDFALLGENERFEWGGGRPLEKVVANEKDLAYLMSHPKLFRNSIAIVEPWEHVGKNGLLEEVRASRNVAYLAQKIADCDSYLLPVWSSGLFDPDQLVPLISSGLAVVVEGGHPTVRDASSFEGAQCSLNQLQSFTEKLLLARSPTSAIALFICLGHQLAAQAHIGLIRRAVAEVLDVDEMSRDTGGKMLQILKVTCARIQEVGLSLEATKKHAGVVARGWEHPEFAVGPNERKEVGGRRLVEYRSPDTDACAIPQEIISAHDVTADEHEGVIDTTLKYEPEVNIAMFHSDEVNEEAMLFANWAYRLIHDALIPFRHLVAAGPLSWLLQLPDALEILCSTSIDEEVLTECSATSIIYKDFETKRIRRSFSSQFHPELLSDLRVVGERQPPSYAELKRDDGARLFARLLYEGMQE